MKTTGPQVGLILLLSLSLLTAGCEERNPVSDAAVSEVAANPTKQMREIAWNSISARSQETVKIDWKQAEVAEIRGEQVPFPLMDSTKKQQEIPDRLVQVTFPTTQDMTLGAIIVYLDPASGEKIGLAPRK